MKAMTRAQVDEYADAHDVELQTMDGYDDCIVGLCTQFNRTFVVYDRAKVIAKLAKDMTHEEAVEFHDFNQAGAWVGDSTPGFLDLGEDEAVPPRRKRDAKPKRRKK